MVVSPWLGRGAWEVEGWDGRDGQDGVLHGGVEECRSAGVYTLLGCTAVKGVGGATREDNGVSVSVSVSASASVSTYSL